MNPHWAHVNQRYLPTTARTTVYHRSCKCGNFWSI